MEKFSENPQGALIALWICKRVGFFCLYLYIYLLLSKVQNHFKWYGLYLLWWKIQFINIACSMEIFHENDLLFDKIQEKLLLGNWSNRIILWPLFVSTEPLLALTAETYVFVYLFLLLLLFNSLISFEQQYCSLHIWK